MNKITAMKDDDDKQRFYEFIFNYVALFINPISTDNWYTIVCYINHWAGNNSSELKDQIISLLYTVLVKYMTLSKVSWKPPFSNELTSLETGASSVRTVMFTVSLTTKSIEETFLPENHENMFLSVLLHV